MNAKIKILKMMSKFVTALFQLPILCGITICCLILLGCQGDTINNQETIPIDFVRYDQELVAAVKNDQLNSLIDKYPLFSEVFAQNVISSPGTQVQSDSVILTDFVNNVGVSYLYDTVQHIIGDLNEEKELFAKAITNYNHLFPNNPIPKVFTCLSEFGIGAFSIEEDIIGLSLDFYLGVDFPYPNLKNFPGYVRKSMDKDHMVMRGMQSLIETQVPMPETERMLDIMCRNGKVLYLLTAVMPFESEHIILDYSQEELDWCKKNESEMWSFFLDEELLYETNLMRIQYYVGAAPHSAGMPEQAPGRTANWLGYQIINKLMAKEKLSIEELLSLQDAQEIIERANYKGR